MLNSEDLQAEITFTTSRSSGPGGQNVNKVDSKVTLRFDVKNSELLSEEQKSLLLKKLITRLNKYGVLILSSQASRSQLSNKKTVLERFDQILEKAFTVQKPRKKRKPSKSAIEKRLKEKRELKEKKERRRKIGD